MLSKGQICAKNILSDCGLEDIIDTPLDLFVSGLGGIFIEEALNNCDGKIIFGNTKAIIKVNSNIQFQERKRFVTAHEIGHLIMHKGMELPEDTFAHFNIIAGMEKSMKFGIQELEANDFASELLMPEQLFLKEVRGKKFTPDLIRLTASHFKTSLTATVFRYLQFNLHPICIVFTENGKVKYWKKSQDFKSWPADYNRLPPPSDSVAMEYIQNDYRYIYSVKEKPEDIRKSTWFKLSEDEEDTNFYEYCIPSKRYKTILSIIWED